MNNYNKTMWVDHLVENPDKYNIIYNPDNSITISPLEGEVFQEGTPINAIHLNKIEEGIYQALTGEILLGEFQGESRKLVLRKGTQEAMPALTEGELGYATDTRKLFMGTSKGNASVMPDIDVTGAVEEVIDRRVNHVKNKSLSQIVIEEMQGIKDFFVNKINERINSVTNKPLNQVLNETILAAKDALYAHVEACKNVLVNHTSWLKDVLVGHVTAEANSIRGVISSGASPTIKSIQRGFVAATMNMDGRDSNIATNHGDHYIRIYVTPVNVNKAVFKSVPRFTTLIGGTGSTIHSNFHMFENGGIIRLYCSEFNLNGGYSGYIAPTFWELIEYY